MSVTPFDQFVAFARARVPRMTDQELEPIRRARVAKAAKGEYLSRLGDLEAGSNFILRGLVRQVFYGPDGRERVNSFATEDSLVCPFRAMLTMSVSDLAIQALEPTWYLTFGRDMIPELVERYPGWRELSARLTEAKFVTAELRNRTLLLDDAAERYRSFLEQYAEIASRVPLTQIAAYIGVTPEALSRIRRRKLVTA